MSGYKIVVNKLSQDELTYELTIRGIALGSVDEMRKGLAMARRMERSGDSVNYPSYPYASEEDIEAAQLKLDELAPLVASFNDSDNSSDFKKYETKLYHVLNRVDHIPEDVEERGVLRAKALSLLDDLHRKSEEFKPHNVVPPQVALLHQSSFNTGIGANRRSTCTNIASVPPPSTPTTSNVVTASNVKAILPNKWDCKFSGDRRGLSLSAFLERVEELRIARHVSKQTLLESGIDLFSGRAYQFYLAYRNEVTDWDQFVELLREEYLSPNYNEKLFEEIRKRTQGPDESIGIYLAIMNGYFNRLTCNVTEDTKLQVLLRNIAPFYQNQLALVDVTSVAQLRELGRKLEARKDAVDNFLPPSRKGTALEPDLAYVQVGSSVGSSVSSEPVSPKGATKEIVCFRCHQVGHYARGCMVKGKKFCYRCKHEGVTVKTCPNCGSKGNAN